MTIDFSSMPIAAKPPGFTERLTGQGEAVCWQVLEDPSAPGGRVVAETSRDTADYRFPLCIYDGVVAKDVEVSTRFKAVDGEVDQAAGVIVRAKDHLNYYVTRANALENNIRLYKVVAGVRRQIAGQNVEVTAGVWHTLSLKADSLTPFRQYCGSTISVACLAGRMSAALPDHSPLRGTEFSGTSEVINEPRRLTLA